MILSVIEQMSEQMSEQMINHVNNWEKANKEQNNKSVTAELERYKERVKTFEQRLNIDLSSREKMIDSQMDDMIKEKLALKEQVDLLEQNLSKQIKEKELGQSAQTVHMLTKPQPFYDNIHKQALGYQNPFHFKKAQQIKPTLYNGIVMSDTHVAMPVIDDEETLILEEENFGKRFTPQQELDAEQAFWFRISNPTIESSNPPHVKVEVPSELPKTVFDQIDDVVQQFSVDKQCLEIAKKELLLENDRLLQQIMSQDVILTVMNSMSLFGVSVNMDGKRKESCNLELQDKDSTICKLKDIIKSMREKSKEENVNYDYCDIKTKNVELESSVAKFLSENDRLCNEINHVKQVFKEQFDSIKKTRVRTKEQSDFLIDKQNLKSVENEDLKAQIQNKVFVITSLKNDLRKLKGKEIVDIAAQIPSASTNVLGMFKLDLEPLAPRLLQNREAHLEYLKYTQEQADILQEIVEQAKAKQPLDSALDFACCCHTQKNVKKVRIIEPLTSSSNIKQVESSKTSDSNTPVLSSIGLKCSTSKCGSNPTGNKKNDRISQKPSSNMKNKVEAQPRKVNKKNSVVEHIHDVDVKHSLLNANSEPICATCKKSMFDGIHDMCLLDFVENVNSRAKSTKKHKNKIFGNLQVMYSLK
ncbi:hypothetical protein Tco_0236261 [Tanacetum coccineum]